MGSLDCEDSEIKPAYFRLTLFDCPPFKVELRAIAQVFGVTIEVVQGEGPVVVVKGDREHLDKSKPGKSRSCH